MKLGLITDIHESVEFLHAALERFCVEQVEQVVVLGDVIETGERIEETCRLLLEAKAIGVWGNHDFGMCTKPSASLRQKYGDVVMNFMATLNPRFVISDCLFQHVEPWLNPKRIADLWYFEGSPDEPDRLQRTFRKLRQGVASSGRYHRWLAFSWFLGRWSSCRIAFSGHYHRWLLATPEGRVDWAGETPVTLAGPERYFVVVKALCDGGFAVFDTGTWELVPWNVDA